MLYRYAATNFQSFLERVEVDLTVNRRAPDTDWLVTAPTGDRRIAKVMCCIGANGAGKTALLKPLAFMAWFIADSFQHPVNASIPIHPHFSQENVPVELECEADYGGQLWRYVLRCTPERVLHEALYCKHERWRYVFVRDWNAGKNMYDFRQQDFGLDHAKAVETRPNISVISLAAQYGVPLALRLASTKTFSNIGVLGRVDDGFASVLDAAKRFAGNERLRLEMQRLLCRWDFGLSGVEIRESEITRVEQPDVPKKVWMPFGHHQSHGKTYELPLVMESSGTKSAFSMLSFLLPVLADGGLAVMDEFESDLHPRMLEAILGLFASTRTNPHNAQLIFSSHALEVLNILDKRQFMLVEKDDNCDSSAIRLDDIKDSRADVSLYAKYMAGAFGAVPNL